jgi:hypothetical protein
MKTVDLSKYVERRQRREQDRSPPETVDLSKYVERRQRREQDRSPPETVDLSKYLVRWERRQQDRNPPITITNKNLWEVYIAAAVRDLDAFVIRYADLRRKDPELEPVFVKLEQGSRRLSAEGAKLVRPRARPAE